MSVKTKPENPPAFPAYEEVDHMDDARGHYVTRVYPVEGMTLRDYFAAKAMQEVMDKGDPQLALPWPAWCQKVAEASYEMADAMLKERSKP